MESEYARFAMYSQDIPVSLVFNNGRMSNNFGSQFEINWPENWPKTVPKYFEFGLNLLKNCVKVEKPKPLTIKKLKKNSEKFPIKFPIDSCRIKTQPSDRLPIIQEQASSAYPVIHERVLWLYIRFLEHKSKYGDKRTKNILSKMSLVDFIDRLLKKRLVVFVGESDTYTLLSGKKGYDFYKNKPGTSLDKAMTRLRYFKIFLFSMTKSILNVQAERHLINVISLRIYKYGTRTNCGKVQEDKNLIEPKGVIIGLIGSRFERPSQMEFQDILITEDQNTPTNGCDPMPNDFASSDLEGKYYFRSMWNEFYDEPGVVYEQATVNDKRYIRLNNNSIFDSVVMKKRYTVSFDTLLFESETRAKQLNKKAYIHVVGIGLGVWKITHHQEEIFLRAFEQRLEYLADILQNIGWVNFAWFRVTGCGDIKHGNIIRSEGNQNGVKIFITNRNPADKLCGEEFENSLLVVTWAWDANSLPGNEFWAGGLHTSSDPSAASSTLITELHNPHINTSMISGRNLHIVSSEFGTHHISDYAKIIVG